MNRHEFRRIVGKHILVLDGATGTELVKRGLPAGTSPEAWVLENPTALIEVQRSYMRAGSEVIYAPTFGANPVKLAEFGLRDRAAELNTELAKLSHRAFPGGLIFGDMAPTGQLVEPYGPLGFEECVAVYREQAAALIQGGVNGFAVETMMDLQEARAALIAIRELNGELPVIVTMTFEPGGRTLTGVNPVSALVTLQKLGADAFGCNCSTGPAEMAEIIAELKPYADIPLVAKPNAGMPHLRDGRTVFDLGPDEFAQAALKLAESGANLIGGCCGTTPAHIAALQPLLARLTPQPIKAKYTGIVASPQRFRRIAAGAPFTIIGERINPTGKKALQAELRAGKLDLVKTFAREQTAAGAALLDVNLGVSGIDEAAMMRRAIAEIVTASPLPLAIDTTNPAAAEAALRLYPGRALFNSISAERKRIETMLPIAARYGALPVLLPLTDDEIPETAERRLEVLKTIVNAGVRLGLPPNEWVADALVMTISANPNAALAALEFIARCNASGMATTCGLSNVSFGLPDRQTVNLAFMGLAAGRGLASAIANLATPGLTDLAGAADALLGRDPDLKAFLAAHGGKTKPDIAAAVLEPLPTSPRERLGQAVLDGRREAVENEVKSCLDAGDNPAELVNAVLIPALNEVGRRFECKEYYLPQLMQSAEAMRLAMARLEPELRRNDTSGGDAQDKPVFVVATVKGDIHDIGKNIVVLLLKNHNFDVVDLGKDVAPEVIVDVALEKHAAFVGLSALMTTTMPKMKETIDLARSRGLDCPFFVGGAAVDPTFAEAIGACYGADAMATVRRALELLKR